MYVYAAATAATFPICAKREDRKTCALAIAEKQLQLFLFSTHCSRRFRAFLCVSVCVSVYACVLVRLHRVENLCEAHYYLPIRSLLRFSSLWHFVCQRIRCMCFSCFFFFLFRFVCLYVNEAQRVEVNLMCRKMPEGVSDGEMGI